jgi:hypothetical protein
MTTTLTFLDWHQPGLRPGDYTITVEQSIQEIQEDSQIPLKIPLDKFPPTTRHFSVLGPRFTLDPQEIQEMFPPPGSLGDHANVLPHIILKRSTLPWERSVHPGPGDAPSDIPWLALLLFEEQEIKERPLKLSELRTQKYFPDLGPPETGDHNDDHVTVIDVPNSLLQQLIPTIEALKYLAHVRQNTETKEEVAVLIGNRLPTPGGMSIVHLVSLEKRYAGDAFDDQKAQPTDVIPLVSLKSWRFACVSTKQSFKGLLTHLNHRLLFHVPPEVTAPLVTMLNTQQIPEAIRAAFALSARPLTGDATVREYNQWRITDRGNRYYLVSNRLHVFNQAGKQMLTLDAAPNEHTLSEQPGLVAKFKQAKHTLDDAKATIAKPTRPDHWWIQDRSRQYFISQEKDTLYVYDLDPDSASTLRLPPLKEVHGSANTVIDTYLKRGGAPLPHAMRQGNQTVSWYHGPFTPGRNTTSKDVPLPIRCAAALLRYNQDSGMLDVSYAAAWELGRLLTLQKTQVAIDLFNWKRAHAHDEQLQMAENLLAHLPYEQAQTDLALPQTVTQWFTDLACLRGVPFAYLVPDERMLPLESIRFFWVDWRWMACLLDGAFSVGRVMTIDHARDQQHVISTAQGLVQTRHDIVTGVLLRSDVVSGWPGLLVDGYADENDTTPLTLLRMERLSKHVLLCLFADKVTAVDMHQRPETLHFGFNRPDPLDSGANYYKEKTERIHITWQDPGKRVVKMETLADKLGSGHAAQFALDMIEGVERVRFQLS